MARVHIRNEPGKQYVEVTLSRRNLLSLLHKLDMPDSMRTLHNNDTWEDGHQTTGVLLILQCEDDEEHYAKRLKLDDGAGPGIMHPDTERHVTTNGGAPGEVLHIRLLPNDD